MNNREDDNVKMLNDGNPNHREETLTVQPINRHERRKEAALSRKKKRKPLKNT